ncbi:MAG: hypothetical protein KJ601_02350 [Nanoarchaeota archaeon]|nr:hypothetical protein [Nanoarchaeota archaeon]MBU1704509.1 hypothetical protein [Nanoarchaeota archaeon]
MNEKQIKNALIETEQLIVRLYGEMEANLGSKRGRNFQFMMLERSFSAAFTCHCLIRERDLGKEKVTSPLDSLNL